MNLFLKVYHWLNRLVDVFAMILLAAMTMIISYQVFMRFIFNHTPYWSSETTLLLMVWFGFIGMSIGFRDHLHISVEVVYNKMNPIFRLFCDILIDLLIIGVGTLFVSEGLRFTALMGNSTMSATKLPSSYLYASIPTAGVLMILYGLILLVKQLIVLKMRKAGDS
ncbi:TRAP transporter small permease [Tuberibacillus sp. Marseille-P3662]|uniref:TRAP transporter small permease n=1 Tax=Tuberibacillus sp. Marseille-P3662 TaxID=1965358 RepID=UPI00159486F8|nr:TRAP transporter small permease [Tuberibacillus sp. Marseille-P3662]